MIVCSSGSKSLHLAPPSLHAWPHRDYSQEVLWSPYPSPSERQWLGATGLPHSNHSSVLSAALLWPPPKQTHHWVYHFRKCNTKHLNFQKHKAKPLPYATACSPWIMEWIIGYTICISEWDVAVRWLNKRRNQIAPSLLLSQSRKLQLCRSDLEEWCLYPRELIWQYLITLYCTAGESGSVPCPRTFWASIPSARTGLTGPQVSLSVGVEVLARTGIALLSLHALAPLEPPFW